METRKLLKIAPVVLAFMLLVPIGVMAQPQTKWYTGTDQSTIASDGSVTWNQYINQHLNNVPIGYSFSWNNDMTNNYGSTTYPVVDVGETSGPGNTDKLYPPSQSYPLSPGYSTGIFPVTTVNVLAVQGGVDLGVFHQYWLNGPDVLNQDQTYTGV